MLDINKGFNQSTKQTNIMIKTISQLSVGTIGFAIGTPLLQVGSQAIDETIRQAGQALENPSNGVKGLIVAGAFQLIFKLVDAWLKNRKEKKAAKEAATKSEK